MIVVDIALLLVPVAFCVLAVGATPESHRKWMWRLQVPIALVGLGLHAWLYAHGAYARLTGSWSGAVHSIGLAVNDLFASSLSGLVWAGFHFALWNPFGRRGTLRNPRFVSRGIASIPVAAVCSLIFGYLAMIVLGRYV